ncbi:MAG TPA: peptide-methionine (S)-S-oxide reductase MsrA [Gemmatimonadaceae bacterium]|jgi:peptide-methionine (S)-S-oxide reductase
MIQPIVRGAAVLGATIAAVALVASHFGSAALSTPVPGPALDATHAPTVKEETAVLSGGCFWGMQAVFEHVKGVTAVTSGYAGGVASTASYEQVETGSTGQAESVRIVFDPSQVTYGQLLHVFFAVHDPTELNRQGPDVGPQYRSSIFYTTDEQKNVAVAYIAQLERVKTFSEPIVTKVVPYTGFFPAEAYHQGYFDRHPDDPYIVINDRPKVAHLRQAFASLYRETPVR